MRAKDVPTDRLVIDTGLELQPDPTRVITRFFVPGREEVGGGHSRAAPVIQRILDLPEADVEVAMADVDERFRHRHADLNAVFREHAGRVMSRIDPELRLSEARRLLLGASFTNEYSIEGGALCNPSAVLHPRQNSDGSARFIISVRGIGEGHRSSIGFRTGTLGADGAMQLDAPGPFPVSAVASPGTHHRSVFYAVLGVTEDETENVAFALEPLSANFGDLELKTRITALATDDASRAHTGSTIDHLRSLARCSYRAEFPVTTDLSERVLWPHAPVEMHGMEDARFVRFTEPSGEVSYYATYTAFNGFDISQQLLHTIDFLSFAMTPLAGAAAMGKGFALFPRRINGRYAALSRSDRETNAIAFSDDLHCWQGSEVIQTPDRFWEVLQLGNCGSPIETDRGWLVLTHGVGPMRTYSIGAILLALDDPRQVIAHTAKPILSPNHARRDGYVPNVVYTCGGFVHGDTLVLPYGVADQSIAIATVSVTALLDSMTTVTGA